MKWISRFLLVVIVLLTSTTHAYEINVPVFKLETPMHTGGVNQIVLSEDENLCLSVSDDKTARLWPLNQAKGIVMSPNPSMIFRPYTASADLGRLQTGSISNNQQTVAVSGELYASEAGYFVALFSIKDGTVVQTLGAFTNPIERVQFSFEEDDLIVCSAGLVHVYSNGVDWPVFSTQLMGNVTAIQTDAFVKKIFLSTDAGFIYTLAKNANGYYQGKAYQKENTKAIQTMSLSPDGKFLAFCREGDNLVEVLDATTLTRLKTFNNAFLQGDITSLDWTARSDGVLAAGEIKHPNGDYAVVKWNLDNPSERQIQPLCDQEPKQIKVLANGNILFVTERPALVLKPPFESLAKESMPIVKAESIIRDNPDEYDLKCTDNGNIVFLKNKTTGETLYFDAQRLFLTDQITGLKEDALAKARTFHMNLNLVDWHDNSLPKLNYDTLPLEEGERAYCITISENGREFLMGTSHGVRKYNKAGTLLWMNRTDSEIKKIVLTQDGQKVITLNTNGILSWYRGSDGTLLANLFIPNNSKTSGAWALWTPLGYFAAAGQAEKMVGWHVNRQWTEAADFFDFGRFFRDFYYPQIPLNAILNLQTDSQQLAFYNLTPPTLTQEILGTPLVEFMIAYDMHQVSQSRQTITITAVDESTGIEEIRLYLNGKRQINLTNQTTTGKEVQTEWEITLKPGENNLEAVAINKVGLESEKKTVDITLAIDTAESEPLSEKPDLYIIASGVSIYKDSGLNLSYAHKDAEEIAELLAGKTGDLYERVHTDLLNNNKALKTNIFQQFEMLKTATKPQDTLVFYFSGHGLFTETTSLDSIYSLALYDTTRESEKTNITTEELEQLINSVPPQNIIVIIDACHAAKAVDFESLTHAYTDRISTKLAKNAGIGVFLSSAGEQPSYESYDLKHGVFTYAFIKAAQDTNTDTNNNRLLELSELSQQLIEIVPALSMKYEGVPQDPQTKLYGKDFSLITR